MWISFINWISQSASWLLVGVLIAGLIVIIGFIIWKLKDFAILSIILAASAGIIFTIPLISTVNYLVEKKAEEVAISEKKLELKTLVTQIENESLKKANLEKENKILEQELKLGNLNKEISLLKASQVSAMQFQKIAEVALIKTKMKQTKVWYESLSDLNKGLGLKASSFDDKVLVVNTYDIDPKFGINFNSIKVKKIDDNKIQVSGIIPSFIGFEQVEKINHIKEIRRNDYDKNNNLIRTTVNNNDEALRNAAAYESKYDSEYQTSLKNMENWSFLEESLVSLGENFVRMILGNVYENIEFVESSDDSFLPLESYLLKEIAISTEESNKLTDLLPIIENAKTVQEQ